MWLYYIYYAKIQLLQYSAMFIQKATQSEIGSNIQTLVNVNSCTL